LSPAAGQHLFIMISTTRFVFLFAVLAALVLAAPSPLKRSLAKRSFVVPRQLNTAHPTGPNGPAAMRKVFRKYGWVIKDDFVAVSRAANSTAGAAAAAAGGNKTGAVAANPGENAALFLSPVDIGGQTLNLDFDSGSSDL
jgi:hypothetical protein